MSGDIRRLLRALLRQCTYLPDPAARTYFHAYVLSRFRDYFPRPILDQSGQKQELIDLHRAKSLTTAANKILSLLTRANAGHLDCLTRVLELTCGRKGKRRHALLHSLRLPDVPNDHTALAQLSISKSQTSPPPLLPPKLEAVLKVQMARKAEQLSRLPVRGIEPVIPETNSWGRKMPLIRVKNIKKKWLAETLDKVLPPLPEAEFARLRDLATGRARWEGLLPRRGLPGTVLSKQQHAHVITGRLMRRLWAKVLLQCSVMRWDASVLKWRVTWGSLTQGNLSDTNPSMPVDTTLFDDINEKGKPAVAARQPPVRQPARSINAQKGL
ncbi:hypothetical protein MMC12_000428 [Toensbergia leucococca]|nr:hypothetical protein [Toensbergia leucococca]